MPISRWFLVHGSQFPPEAGRTLADSDTIFYMVKTILKLEGLALLIASVYGYYLIDGNWVTFALLILVPDISMIGYQKDSKLGALSYNAMHNYVTSFTMIGFGLLINHQLILALGIILSAHISMDRMIGYGLKYSSDFKHTHFKKV